MKLTLHGHDDRYAVEQLQLSLFPDNTEGEAVSSLHRGKVWLTAVTKITVNGTTAAATRRIKAADETVRLRRRALQQSYYLAAKQLLPVTPPWGALAGVRPTKITTKHLLEGGTPKSADELLRDVYYVTDDRRRLAVDCSVSTVRAVNMLQPSDLSLYVGIPFCPTRCTYCSFVSRTIGRKTELLEPYLRALEQEIAVTGRLLAQSGRTIRTLYIGGGTPTSLSAAQLRQLMGTVRENFDLTKVVEYTVEAGRPDCTDAEKLAVIKEYGATRISINPQTFSDEVLANIGRKHSAQDILDCYADARRAGHEDINMDLIAGLPGDTVEGFEHSLRQAIALQPENITVHTLTLKRASRIVIEDQKENDYADVAAMLEKCHLLAEAGYRPYYLYRQKNTLQNLENVGWCKPGHEGYYNIYIMEEVQTILSAGAGGSTKLVADGGKRMQRIFNFKYPNEYIQRFAEVLERKKGVAEFYDHNLGTETTG